MAGVTWCEEERGRYLYIDYSSTTERELLELMAVGSRVAAEAPVGFRMLVNVAGAAMSSAYLKQVKEDSRVVLGPKSPVIAVIGLSGLQTAMLRGFNAVGSGARAVPFRDRTSALQYLFSH